MNRTEKVRLILKFIDDNYCMINSLMCNAESKVFDGDIVKEIKKEIKRTVNESEE